MVESEEDSGKTPPTVEGKDSAKGSCLHVSLSKGEDSQVIYEKLESFGFKVIKESSITTAAKLCSSTKMALIVLEDCEDKKFIEAIKSPESWNEHTPIVFISSGPLSDSVRDLMQEQYIDELVFKCLTLECDLGSAVNRLITQPGQFAVTPKSKRPGIVRKRKLETAFSPLWNKQPSASPTSWQSVPSTGHLPLGPPMLHGSDYSQNTYNMNPFMMPLPPVHQQQQQQHQQLQGSVEPKINFHPPGEHMHYGGISYICSHTAQLPPYSQSESNFHPNSVSGRCNAQTKKQHFAQQHMHNTAESGHAQSAFDQWRLPLIVKVEKQQSLNSDQNNKEIAEDSKKSEDSKEKIIQFERKKICKPKFDRSPPDKGSHLQTASPSSAKKSNALRQERNKQKSTGSTSLERKVQHLDKEKQRRERITKSWHWLRQLVPNCDAYADKATVFEMSVAYLHHCWKYHGPLVQNINKEFSSKQKTTIPPEDMESIVTEVIEKETKAFENIGLQSR